MSFRTGRDIGLTASGDLTGQARVRLSCVEDRLINPENPEEYVVIGEFAWTTRAESVTLSAAALLAGFEVAAAGGSPYAFGGSTLCSDLASFPENARSVSHSLSVSAPSFCTGQGTSSHTVNADGPGELIHDVGGSWSVSCTAMELIEEYSLGSPTGWRGNIPDAPGEKGLRIYLALKPGTTYTATATSGDLTRTATGTVPDGPPILLTDLSVALSTVLDTFGLFYQGQNFQFATSADVTGTLLGQTIGVPGFTYTDRGVSLDGTGGAEVTVANQGGLDVSTTGDTCERAGSVYVTRWPPRQFSADGVLRAMEAAYPDPLDVALSRYAGDPTPNLTGVSGSFSRSYTQRRWQATGGVTDGDTPSGPAGSALNEYQNVAAAITEASLTAAGDDSRLTRILIRGKEFAGWSSFALAGSFTVTDFASGTGITATGTGGATGAAVAGGVSTATGPGGLTIAFDPVKGLGPSYTLLRVRCRLTGAGPTALTFAIPFAEPPLKDSAVEPTDPDETDHGYGADAPSKTWTGTTGADGVYTDIDLPLFRPPNASAETEGADNDIYLPRRMAWYDGVAYLGSLSITGIPAGATLEVDSLTLADPSGAEPLVTWLPTFERHRLIAPDFALEQEWEDRDRPDRQVSSGETTSYDYGRRFLQARTREGVSTLAEPDFRYTRTEGGVTPVVSYTFLVGSIKGLRDAVAAQDRFGYSVASAKTVTRHPGWGAATAVPQPAAFVPSYTGEVPPAHDYYYNDGMPAVYLWGGGILARTAGFLYPFDLEPGAAPAQPQYDEVDWWGPCGDFFAYGDGAGIGAGGISLKMGATLRAQAHGIVLDEDKAPSSGVDVEQRQAGATTGTGESGADGYYRTTGGPYAVSPGASSARRASSPGVSVAFSPTRARRRHRAAFVVVVVTPGTDPDNLSVLGWYYLRAFRRSGKIRVQRAPYAVPRSSAGWDVDLDATAGPDDRLPALAYDRRGGRLRLLFARSAGGGAHDVYETVSDDDGETWSTPAVAIPGGTHSRVEHTRDGTLRVAFVPTAPGASSGKLQATFQGAYNAAPGAVFTLQYWNGAALADLAVQDAGFGLSHAHEAQDRLALTVLIDGESDVSDWYSADDGRTWTRVP